MDSAHRPFAQEVCPVHATPLYEAFPMTIVPRDGPADALLWIPLNERAGF
jgi:hypothetical protein